MAAPDGSVTDPRIVPELLTDWAEAEGAQLNTRAMQKKMPEATLIIPALCDVNRGNPTVIASLARHSPQTNYLPA
jgi:hypothetical protein